MRKPLLIMKTGTLSPEMIEKYGDYDALYPRMAGIPRDRTAVAYVAAGETPEEPGAYCGVLISGSAAMVTDHAHWSEEAAAWLRGAIAANLPVLGICYGHQLLAHALGGEIAYLPGGREAGTVDLQVFPEAGEHPWLRDVPEYCQGNVVHSQGVRVLPPQARVLGRSQRDPHQIVLYAPRVMGLQFHPEFGGEFLRDCLTFMAVREPSLKGLYLQLAAAAKDTPRSLSILRNFAADALENTSHS